jgi:hypothetical protein
MAEEDEVWIQLYIEGQGKIGRAFKIRVEAQADIDDLAKAVYKDGGKSLEHCEAFQLEIFKAGTEFPPKEKDKLRPGKPVPKDTTDENPLRVMAPVNQSGKN